MLTGSRPLTSALKVVGGEPLIEKSTLSDGVKLELIVPMTFVPSPETSGLTAM